MFQALILIDPRHWSPPLISVNPCGWSFHMPKNGMEVIHRACPIHPPPHTHTQMWHKGASSQWQFWNAFSNGYSYDCCDECFKSNFVSCSWTALGCLVTLVSRPHKEKWFDEQSEISWANTHFCNLLATFKTFCTKPTQKCFDTMVGRKCCKEVLCNS